MVGPLCKPTATHWSFAEYNVFHCPWQIPTRGSDRLSARPSLVSPLPMGVLLGQTNDSSGSNNPENGFKQEYRPESFIL